MASSKRDYYEVLGVAKDASGDDVKKAYRQLALKFHPDRNPGDHTAEDKFKEATEAFDVLFDAKKRAHYDRFGHVEPGQGGFSGFDPSTINDIFGDFFGDIFGGRGRRGGGGSSGVRGSDLRYNLEIEFDDAAFGKALTLTIPRLTPCEVCEGSGAKKGTRPSACPTCKGAGELHVQRGFFQMSQTCPRCAGSGRVVTDPCASCKGEGRVEKTDTVAVEIPKGAYDGLRIRYIGKGEAGASGGGDGDLYVVLSVKPHPYFIRDDHDLLVEVPISFTQAALGATIDVPTLDGMVQMKVPAGTQSGKVFGIKGKGMPILNGYGSGDEHVRVVVETPSKLSKEQRELLVRFAEISGADVHPHRKSFFDKVKELLGTRGAAAKK